MDPIYPTTGPETAAGYAPYYYQAGLFLRYDSPFHHARSGVERLPSAHPELSGSGLPIQHFDRLQTVEDVIARGYFAVPSGNPVTAIISDRQHTAHLGLDDVITQVRGRLELYQQNIEELDQAVCEANNAVLRQEADQGMPANQRQQYSASKAIMGIYEQKRTERVNLWRDVSRLRLVLPENAERYLTAYRKLAVLNQDPGDGL